MWAVCMWGLCVIWGLRSGACLYMCVMCFDALRMYVRRLRALSGPVVDLLIKTPRCQGGRGGRVVGWVLAWVVGYAPLCT